MASAFGTNTPNYSSSDHTNNRRIETNYNYVKKMVKSNSNSSCLSSGNGNIKLRPVTLTCDPLSINESCKKNHTDKKLSYVKNYQLYSDITKGFYSPSCYLKNKNLKNNIITDAQYICCEPSNVDVLPNIDGDLQFGLYYQNFDLSGSLLFDISANNINTLNFGDGSLEPMLDGSGNYIVDPSFVLFSDKECCNNYIQNLRNKVIDIESQFNDTNNYVYKSVANTELFKIKYNAPIYFKTN